MNKVLKTIIISDHFFMKVVLALVLVLLTSLGFGNSSLSDAILFMSKSDYSNAIRVLLSIDKTKDNERIINYYLSECYLMIKDFSNSLIYGERVANQKSDFIYKKSLYNIVFSSYMLNMFDKTYVYGSEYLKEVGDSQGIESLVLTMTVNSLASMGEVGKAKDVLNSYKSKYPTLYSLLMSNLERVSSVYKGISGTDKVSEDDKVVLYLNILRDILSSLEEISKRRDSDIEKLEEIIYLLELKERVLKMKKYQIMLDQ